MKPARFLFSVAATALLMASLVHYAELAAGDHTISLVGSNHELSNQGVELDQEDLLNGTSPRFISTLGAGEGAPLLSVDYACVAGGTAAQRPGGVTCDPNAVQVRWTKDGSNPHVSPSANVFPLQEIGGGPSDTTPKDGTFTGGWASAAFNDVPDGTVVRFVLRPNATYSPGDSPGQPSSNTTESDPPSPDFYHFRIDKSQPNITFNSSTDYGVFLNSNIWYLFSQVAKPAGFGFVFKDVAEGSKLDNASFSAQVTIRNAAGVLVGPNADQNANFDKDNSTDHHHIWTYGFPAGNATLNAGFQEDRAWQWTVTALDETKNPQAVTDFRTHRDQEVPRIARDKITSTVQVAGAGQKVPVQVDAYDRQMACVTNSGYSFNAATPHKCGSGVTNLTQALSVTAFFVNETTNQEATTVATLTRVAHQNTPASSRCWQAPETSISHCWRGTVTVPSAPFPSGAAKVKFVATDLAGNVNSTLSATNITLDTQGPAITLLQPAGSFIAAGPYTVRASIVDDRSGVQLPVKLSWRVGNGTSQEASMNFQGGTTYQGSINANPAHGSVVNFTITARDQVGAESTLSRSLTVDKAGPVATPERDLAYLSTGPYDFRFNITDAGSGVNASLAEFHWRVKGTSLFTDVALTRSADGTFGALVADQPEGTVLQWYVEAKDELGNTGGLATRSAPRETFIDKTPPTVVVNAPQVVTDPRFTVSWSGVDALSGVARYSIQFRDDVKGDWRNLVTNTTSTSIEFCAIGGREYSFRGSAEDRAGNRGTLPAERQAFTLVDTQEDCVQAPTVTLSRPSAGADIVGDVAIGWTATSIQFADDELTVSVEVAGPGGRFEAIATGITNDGDYVWRVAALDNIAQCRPDGTYTIRVTARDPSLFAGSATVAGITLVNDIPNCTDRDGNGIADAWEYAHFGQIGVDPNGDPDGDGFSNRAEFEAGSDPRDDRSTPITVGAEGDWSPTYWLVILLFAATTLVFVVGLVRRW